ncbi:MAG TPA: gephyrin-like molybdotransferase Glp [Candidatus Limnocylindrales bacterium]|nr:gephyrin-like molybdotransferase Glp [Candidatus Limnocylindrales bacterium]
MSADTTRELLSVEEARAAILGAVAGPLSTETVDVDGSLGRVLAEDVVAAVTLPPWNNSAMDGYAVRFADVAAAGDDAPVRLRVVGEVPAGGVANGEVGHGSAIRIATGAPIPAGADAVVPVEATTPLDAAGTAGPRGRDAAGPLPAAILVHEPGRAAAHIRLRGSDLSEGATILASGSAMTPAAVALAAGAGLPAVSVRRRPRVAVLATGNEVRPAGTDLGPAGIPDANGPGLRALVEAAGAEAIRLGIAPDDLDDVTGRLRAALDTGADAIVVAGGVSVGPYDVVKLAFESIGEIGLWRVAVQPGKPFAFGTAPRRDGGRALLFGLPGNPVSSFVTFELFVRPAIRSLAGRRDLYRAVDRAVLLDEVRTAPNRRAFLRATAERDVDGSPQRDGRGRVRVRLSHGPAGQGSHVLSALAAADALAVVREDVEVHAAGDAVDLWWLDPA